jgi:oxygen-independent coproporphyrinogen-3 oxidase
MTATIAPPLIGLLRGTPYVAYTYSYPHKTAYRPLEAPVPLRELWAREDRSALFLYVHVPFCEMRCGFCNLFTTVDPAASLTVAYLEALERESERVSGALSEAAFARMAIGGGTPTFLDAADLVRIFDLTERRFGVRPGTIPCSVETSPATAEPEKLRLLRERGVDRVSIGVQSLVEAEARAAGRSQRTADVERAIAAIRAEAFPILNIDLIYGLPDQTVESWLGSLRAALRFVPEELFLYPLYVRPLTGLGRRGTGVDPRDDLRLACYRAGRELLLAAGYTQVTMRMFRAAHAPAETGPDYCVQDDGMVGLGCGARSYTTGLHYSGEYAVGSTAVRAILVTYATRPAESFESAAYGIHMSGEEQRRRYAIKSLLEAGGLPFDGYRRRFGADVTDDLPQLHELVEYGLACADDGHLCLTDAGVERSDVIGPWLYSARVRELMGGYRLR